MRVKDNGCFYCENQERDDLMICCERCEVWFHYKCVNNKWDLHLRKNQLIHLSDYYCYPCRRANPSLKLKFYSSANYKYVYRLKSLNEDGGSLLLKNTCWFAQARVFPLCPLGAKTSVCVHLFGGRIARLACRNSPSCLSPTPSLPMCYTHNTYS